MSKRYLMAALALSVATAACTDPVIQLSFRMPSAAQGGDFDTSCITAIDVYTVGSTQDDVAYDCIELAGGPATLAGLPAVLSGKIDVPLPLSDLTAVEVLGLRGSCADDDLPDGEMVFYAGAPYIGTDDLVLPIDATSSCDQAPLTVRPIDIIALVSGPTKGDCAAAAAVDGLNAGGDIGTMAPTVTGEVVFNSGLAGASLRDGVVSVPGAMTTIGPKACLAASAGDARFGSMSCLDRNRPTACAQPGEVELAGIDGAVAFASIDQAKKNRFPGLIFTAVVDGNRQPIAGATVQLDDKHGEIVYVEPAGAGLAPTGGTSTGPSGLFIAYTDTVTTMKVSAAGRTQTVTIGSVPYSPGAALVVMR